MKRVILALSMFSVSTLGLAFELEDFPKVSGDCHDFVESAMYSYEQSKVEFDSALFPFVDEARDMIEPQMRREISYYEPQDASFAPKMLKNDAGREVGMMVHVKYDGLGVEYLALFHNSTLGSMKESGQPQMAAVVKMDGDRDEKAIYMICDGI